MPSPTSSHAPRFVPWMERLVVVALAVIALGGVAASVFLGPTVLVVVLIAGLAVFALEPLVRGSEAHETARHAADAGIQGQITLWGKVVDVTGRCPNGSTPDKGETFVVTDGKVWPALCPHAEEAILHEVTHMEGDGNVPDQPVYYHDTYHAVRMELYRAPSHLRAA